MKYRTMLLFGAPGSGKGTLGKVLGALPNCFHCACGDVFRSLRKDTPMGKVFEEYSSRGQLVPDGPTVEIWRDFIQRSIAEGRFQPDRDTLLLDGIPRNVVQAELLEESLEVVAIIHLACDRPEVLVERLQRRAFKEGRLDDTDLEVIRHRLETFERETRPVLEYYPAQRVHRVDASPSPMQVLHDVLGRLLKVPEVVNPR